VICGVLQVMFGFLKAGVIADYVPGSVIKGMLAAIGIILILKQLPHLVGYNSDFPGDESFTQPNHENTFSSLANAINYITPIALVTGIICLVFQFSWEKFTSGKKGFIKLVPAPLVVVLIGIGLNELVRTYFPAYAIGSDHLVTIPAANSGIEFFNFFTSPDWSFITSKEVLIAGVTLALVASLETLLSIEAIDDLDPYQRVTDKARELKAQGVGNMISGLIGGLPITSVIVRSSANVNAGAKTKMAAVYHGGLLLLSVAFIPALLNLIPNSALAAVLIFTGYKLAKPSLFKLYYLKGWDQFMPFVITIVAILFTDLLVGVFIGIGVGLFFVIRSNFRTSVFVVKDDNKYLFRLRKDVSFLNKPIIKNKLEQVAENATVIIDISRADFLDKDVVEVIDDFKKHAPLKNIKVLIHYNLFQKHIFGEETDEKEFDLNSNKVGSAA
jgi:MFS superfamily sulfate permease-like transporter